MMSNRDVISIEIQFMFLFVQIIDADSPMSMLLIGNNGYFSYTYHAFSFTTGLYFDILFMLVAVLVAVRYFACVYWADP